MGYITIESLDYYYKQMHTFVAGQCDYDGTVGVTHHWE